MASIEEKRLMVKRIMAQQIMQKQEAVDIEANKGFGDRVGDKLQQREGNIQESRRATAAGEQGRLEGGFQQAGQAAGAGLDVLGEGIVTGAKAINNALGGVPGDVLRGGANIVGKLPAGDSTLAQQLPQDIGKISDSLGAAREEHPRAFRNLDALGNIASVAAPAVISGKTIKAGGTARKAAGKQKFAEKLIEPRQIGRKAKEQTARQSKENAFRTSVRIPSKAEKGVAASVAKVKGVSKNKTNQANLNAIDDAISVESKALKTKLKESKATYVKTELKTRINKAREEALEEGLRSDVTGKLNANAEAVFTRAEKIIDSKSGNLGDLLDARIELDKFVRSLKGDNAFSDKADDFTRAFKKIRNTMNDFLDEKAIDVDVKDSLKQQSDLFRALDEVVPKAAADAKTPLKRFIDKSKSKNSALTGTAQTLAPVVQGAREVAALPFKGAQAVVSPTSQELLGSALSVAPQVTTPANRALLIELMKNQQQN